ncbi:MAG: ATP-binding protein, partial [Tumebacillaceae bacterium]
RDRWAVITIADDGPGIAEDHMLENLFVPFYTTKENGTGLGLPVCKSIIEFHNGMIEVLRNVPRGLVFRVSLPAL